MDALLWDLSQDLVMAGDRPIETVFLGGGTPSLFAPEHIDRLLSGVRARCAVVKDVEVTMEANPGTIEHGRFSGYRDAGVNRVSLGAQSFGARQLELLGRIHGPAEIHRALEELETAEIANFNLDLMHGLPEQVAEDAASDMEMALEHRPPHLSHYQLTLEPGTVFHSRPPTLPDEDLLADIQETAQRRLEAAGLRQYEVSAWARPGYECRHNLNYWRFGDYLGIGAGAHGKLTDVATDRIMRTEKAKQPRDYLARAAGRESLGQVREVARSWRGFEYLLNGLRLCEGVTHAEFEARTGLAITAITPGLEEAAGRGLLLWEQASIRATPLGMRFLSDLQAIFLPEALTE